MPEAAAGAFAIILQNVGFTVTCCCVAAHLAPTQHYPGTTNSADKQGCKQYAWNTTDGEVGQPTLWK